MYTTADIWSYYMCSQDVANLANAFAKLDAGSRPQLRDHGGPPLGTGERALRQAGQELLLQLARNAKPSGT